MRITQVVAVGFLAPPSVAAAGGSLPPGTTNHMTKAFRLPESLDDFQTLCREMAGMVPEWKGE
jgi:hypothetical protein